MLTVKKFCFCCELTTAAIIYAWLNIIFGIICVIILIILEGAKISAGLFPDGLHVILIVVMFGYIFFYNMLIRGVKEWNHKRIFPAMYIEVDWIISVIYLLFLGTFEAYITVLIRSAISFYIFICLNSLYVRFYMPTTATLPTQYTPLQRQQQQQQTYMQPEQQMVQRKFMQPMAPLQNNELPPPYSELFESSPPSMTS